jgi:hypothetical protein
MMQVLATSSPLKLQDAREDNFKKTANKLNGVLIKTESHAIALRNSLNTYEQKSAAFCRMGGVRPPSMNAFSRMGAMLTDFIQAIPPSAAPPPIVNFPIQVGAPPPAAPAIEPSNSSTKSSDSVSLFGSIHIRKSSCFSY